MYQGIGVSMYYQQYLARIYEYRIAGYLHGKLFSRTCQNPLETEMLTEEKFAKRAMALIMIMFTISPPGAYNHILSDVYTCVVFDIVYIYTSQIQGYLGGHQRWYGFLFLPSVASTAMGTSLFASINGRRQNNSWKNSVEIGEFPDWL